MYLNLKYVKDMLSICVPKPEICLGYVKSMYVPKPEICLGHV